jgi:hypothetical protein
VLRIERGVSNACVQSGGGKQWGRPESNLNRTANNTQIPGLPDVNYELPYFTTDQMGVAVRFCTCIAGYSVRISVEIF